MKEHTVPQAFATLRQGTEYERLVHAIAMALVQRLGKEKILWEICRRFSGDYLRAYAHAESIIDGQRTYFALCVSRFPTISKAAQVASLVGPLKASALRMMFYRDGGHSMYYSKMRDAKAEYLHTLDQCPDMRPMAHGASNGCPVSKRTTQKWFSEHKNSCNKSAQQL